MAAAFTDLSTTPQLALLNRCEARVHRMFQRALKNLQMLRETKPPVDSAPAEDTVETPRKIADLPNDPNPTIGPPIQPHAVPPTRPETAPPGEKAA